MRGWRGERKAEGREEGRGKGGGGGGEGREGERRGGEGRREEGMEKWRESLSMIVVREKDERIGIRRR